MVRVSKGREVQNLTVFDESYEGAYRKQAYKVLFGMHAMSVNFEL